MDSPAPLELGLSGRLEGLCRLLVWEGESAPDTSSVDQVISMEEVYDARPGWEDIGLSRGFSYGWQHWLNEPRYEVLWLPRAHLERRTFPLVALALLMQLEVGGRRAIQGVVFETGTVEGEIVTRRVWSDVITEPNASLSMCFRRRRELVGAWYPQSQPSSSTS